eukprot:428027-Prymnesium_polylepis.1
MAPESRRRAPRVDVWRTAVMTNEFRFDAHDPRRRHISEYAEKYEKLKDRFTTRHYNIRVRGEKPEIESMPMDHGTENRK